MFYVLIFGILAVILVVGGLATTARRRRTYEEYEGHATDGDKMRRQRKAKRVQSRHDRRRRP